MERREFTVNLVFAVPVLTSLIPRSRIPVYLEAFNFQAPGVYRTLGYEVAYERAVYRHEIIRYLMVRHRAGVTG